MKTLLDMTEPELKTYFSLLADAIERILPAGPSKNGRALFAILVFDDPGVCQYVSNAQRPDIIKAMRECADRLERNQDLPR
jgi:hypothetical protein